MLTALQSWSVLHNLLAAGVALLAAWALRRRIVSAEARPAAAALRVFWAGLAATAAVQTFMIGAAALGAGPTAALATTLLAFATALAALGSLAAYFAYVFTGSRHAVPAVAAVYALVLALGAYSTIRSEPTSLFLTRWGYDVAYAQGQGVSPSDPTKSIPTVAALVPALVGAVSFVFIGLRSTGPTRPRGILVGTALALWFGALAIGAQTDAADAARKLLSLLGLLAVYLAYLAPKPLQARWALAPIGEEHAYGRLVEERAARERRSGAQLAARARELV